MSEEGGVFQTLAPGLVTVVEAAPVWGPVLTVVAGVLCWRAARLSHVDTEDRGGRVLRVRADVPAPEDTGAGDSPLLHAVTCGDTGPRLSPDEHLGGP